MAGTSPAMTLRPSRRHGQTSSCIIIHYSNLRVDAVSLDLDLCLFDANQPRAKIGDRGERLVRLLGMRRMLASLQDFDIDRRIDEVLDLLVLSERPVRVVITLNGEDRNAPIVDRLGDVPGLEAGIEPGAVPAAERVVDVAMVFG